MPRWQDDRNGEFCVLSTNDFGLGKFCSALDLKKLWTPVVYKCLKIMGAPAIDLKKNHIYHSVLNSLPFQLWAEREACENQGRTKRL